MSIRVRAGFAVVVACTFLASHAGPAMAERDAADFAVGPEFAPAGIPQSLTDVAPSLGDDAVLAEPAAAPGGSDGSGRELSLHALVDAIEALPSVELTGDLQCLATAVYFESRGEPLEGQLAVAQVIRNRVGAPGWPKDVCGVVYQRGQFSFTSDSHSDEPRNRSMWRTAQAVALIAATDNWAELVGKATHFHATRVSPGWNNLRRVSTIGNHVFYR